MSERFAGGLSGNHHGRALCVRFSNLVLRLFALSVYEPRRVYRMQADFELIERARSGDDAAFGQVVSVYRKRILGTISRLIGRPEDVEDVAQDVFLRLYFSLDQLRTSEVFEPWLYRLTVNACYDYLRRQRRRHESRMSDLSEQQVLMADAVAGGRPTRMNSITAGFGNLSARSCRACPRKIVSC